jgi:hypothetical protein
MLTNSFLLGSVKCCHYPLPYGLCPISNYTPGSLTNENLCFALLANQNLEFVALSGCQRRWE